MATDKGYHSREQLKALDGGVWKTRIAEPEPAKGCLRWHGDETARRAVYANRARLKSGIGRETMRRRGELVERSADAFATFIFVLRTNSLLVFGLIALIDAEPAALVVTIALTQTSH